MSATLIKSCRTCSRRRTFPATTQKFIDAKLIHTQGCGLFGGLGHGPDLADSPNFKMLHKASAEDRTVEAKQISAGWGHSAGVTYDGELFVWGRPYDFSNLITLNKIKAFSSHFARFISRMTSDLGSSVDGLHPTPHFIASVGTVVSAHCSAGLTVTLTESGDLYSFGQNRWGQCGSDENTINNLFTPQEVLIPVKVKQVDAGLQHCIALSRGGKEVFTWGKSGRGQLGIKDHIAELHATPQFVRGIEGVVIGVSAGFNHSAALNSEGVVYLWGKGMSNIIKPNVRKAAYNMLTYEDQFLPRILEIPGGRKAVEIISSNYNFIVRCDDQSLWAMGSGEYDRLASQSLLRVQQARSKDEEFSDEKECDKDGNFELDPPVIWNSNGSMRKGFTRVAIISENPKGLLMDNARKSMEENYSPTHVFEVVINGGEAFLKEKSILFTDDEKEYAKGRRIIDHSSGWQHSIVLLEIPKKKEVSTSL